MTFRVAACSSCGRAIIWVVSPNGARLPLDARPVTAYELQAQGDGVAAIAFKSGEDGGSKLYISHFLTCPSVEEHQAAKKPTPIARGVQKAGL